MIRVQCHDDPRQTDNSFFSHIPMYSISISLKKFVRFLQKLGEYIDVDGIDVGMYDDCPLVLTTAL